VNLKYFVADPVWLGVPKSERELILQPLSSNVATPAVGVPEAVAGSPTEAVATLLLNKVFKSTSV
jgi:hypothetical protein